MADSYIYITSKPIVVEPPPEPLVTSDITEKNIIVNIDDQLGAGSDRVQGLFRHTDDFYNVTDAISKSPNKGHSDVTNLTDIITNFTVGLGKFEIPAISDTDSKIVIKSRADQFDLSDRPFKLLSKPFSDLSSITDRPFQLVGKNLLNYGNISDFTTYITGKNLQDTSTLSDVLTTVWVVDRQFSNNTLLQDTKSVLFAKNLFNTSSLSDSVYNHTFKVVKDISETSDVFSRVVNYDRVFNDFAIGTDDIFGNADIDDQQVAAVVKSVLNFTAITDSFDRSITFNRTFQNQSDLSDSSFRAIGKNVLNEAAVTDLFDVDIVFNRTFSHTSTLSDTKYIGFSKIATPDSVSLSDDAILSPNKINKSLSTFTDINFFNISKVVSNISLLSDTIQADISKAKTSNISLVEERLAYQQDYFASADYVQPGYTGQIHSI